MKARQKQMNNYKFHINWICEMTVFHTSRTIHVHPNRGCECDYPLRNQTARFPNFPPKEFFSNWGSSGWGRRSPVKLGGIMCVKHTGVHYQHFASQFIAGGQRRKSIFCTFRRYSKRWQRKLARVEILRVSLSADLRSWSFTRGFRFDSRL